MSLNRRNVIWQTSQGTWSIGFFAFESLNPDSPHFDHEWDVKYDRNRFWWVSAGHADPDAALEAYCAENANPGDASTCFDWSTENATCIARFEELASAWETARHLAQPRPDLPSGLGATGPDNSAFGLGRRGGRFLRVRPRTHLR